MWLLGCSYPAPGFSLVLAIAAFGQQSTTCGNGKATGKEASIGTEAVPAPEVSSGTACKHWRVKVVQRWTLDLASRFATWNFTVRSEMGSLLALSLLERFFNNASRTSRLRRLSSTGPHTKRWGTLLSI